jgi:AcrR family transcriptional regulator
MAQILAERGTAGASVAAVCDGALISRATFAGLFGSPQGCVDALIEDFVDRAAAAIQAAASAQDSWVEGVIAGLQALLRLLDREPAVARACLLEAHASQALAMRRWPQLAERVERHAAPPRAGANGDGLPARLLAEGTLATVHSMLRARLLTAQAPPFSGLLEDLTALVVLPWMGPAAAGSAMRAAGRRRDQPAEPEHPSHVPAPRLLPPALRRANAHRARSALGYVAAHPGASNKQVAAAVDVSHLGQVSKLLARLEEAGLLRKRAGGAGRPNAWSLTEEGRRAADALDGLGRTLG